MTTTNLSPADIGRRNHRKAVRFFWGLLIGATLISVVGNIAHAVLPHLPQLAIAVGAAAVPPIALLAAVHGIAMAVRAGASGSVYRWAVSAVAIIGLGAFTMSFLALRGLMHAIGYSTTTAWVFPAIIDTAVAVSTMMLVALGDKPPRRTRAASAPATAPRKAPRNTKSQTRPLSLQTSSEDPPARTVQYSAAEKPVEQDLQYNTAHDHAAAADADLASEVLASGVTMQSMETVTTVLAAHRRGLSVNAAAKAAGINYRTAQRIVASGAARRPEKLTAVG